MRIVVGARAPKISATLPGGETISLTDLRGRPLLLIFLRHLG